MKIQETSTHPTYQYIYVCMFSDMGDQALRLFLNSGVLVGTLIWLGLEIINNNIIFIVIIMVIKWGVGTRCVPTPKMAYFSVFKAFLFLKYFKNNLGLIESSFNP